MLGVLDAQSSTESRCLAFTITSLKMLLPVGGKAEVPALAGNLTRSMKVRRLEE